MMKSTFQAALLLGASLVMADELKFAKCELTELDNSGEGITGTIMFMQKEGRAMRALGLLDMNGAIVPDNEGAHCPMERRAIDITAGGSDGTCLAEGASLYVLNGGHAVFKDDQQAVVAVAANHAGAAEGAEEPGLFGDSSVLGHSVSLYQDNDAGMLVEACCTITEITDDMQYWDEYSVLRLEIEDLHDERRASRDNEGV